MRKRSENTKQGVNRLQQVDEQMRILIISDVSSHMRGGVPAETRTLMSGLSEGGHVVALASDALLEGCEQAMHFAISLPVQNSLASEVQRALDEFKPEFVHVICMNSKGVTLLRRVLGFVPWVLTVHSLPPYERKLNRWHGHEALHYGARALRFLANSLAWRWVFLNRMVPRVVVHSKYVADIVVHYGYPRDRVNLIPLSIETAVGAQFVRTELRAADAPRLLTVAGFAHTKGQHDVLTALPAMLARFPRIRYQIIGEVRDESYLRYLRKLAQDLALLDHFLITPNLSHADKQAALEGADLYVQPSHEEGFCLAYAEAAAVVPRLVGTHTGAIASMSEGDPGMRIVPIRRPGAIAASVLELLQADLSTEVLSSRMKRMSTDFSRRTYLDSHCRVYEEIARSWTGTLG